MKFLFLLLFISQVTLAQTPTPAQSQSFEADLPQFKWDEVNSIIDEIREQNPPRNYRFKIKTGLVQMITNTADTVKLGQNGNLYAIGGEAVSNFWGNLGIEARGIYAQNIVPDVASTNKADAYMTWLDIGPRYTFYFDNTRLDDNLAFKILYHQSDSNFKLMDTTDKLFITQYKGISFAIERSIPITRKLGVLAAFDLLQIFSAQTPSRLKVVQYGYGFEIQGEIYYQLDIFGKVVRMGVSYWQQGNENNLEDKDFLARNSQFQLARSIFLNLTLLE
ncbi:MAG: hypothetical protein SGI74_03865 [Oligoflexia bacterium]|nr:hypothetical protein [Oligoflexia bacterium]